MEIIKVAFFFSIVLCLCLQSTALWNPDWKTDLEKKKNNELTAQPELSSKHLALRFGVHRHGGCRHAHRHREFVGDRPALREISYGNDMIGLTVHKVENPLEGFGSEVVKDDKTQVRRTDRTEYGWDLEKETRMKHKKMKKLMKEKEEDWGKKKVGFVKMIRKFLKRFED